MGPLLVRSEGGLGREEVCRPDFFAPRRVGEKRENMKKVYVAFVDLDKAYNNNVNRKGL